MSELIVHIVVCVSSDLHYIRACSHGNIKSLLFLVFQLQELSLSLEHKLYNFYNYRIP